jgi:hypothetical protein
MLLFLLFVCFMVDSTLFDHGADTLTNSQEKSSVEVSIQINPGIIGSDPALGAQKFHFQN